MGRLRAGLFVLALAVPATQAKAADARHPYSNIDPRYDAGNDTGDSQVDALNAQQLNGNYRGPYYIGRPPPPGVRPPRLPPLRRPVPPPPGYYGPPGYPPPGYPPPGY